MRRDNNIIDAKVYNKKINTIKMKLYKLVENKTNFAIINEQRVYKGEIIVKISGLKNLKNHTFKTIIFHQNKTHRKKKKFH